MYVYSYILHTCIYTLTNFKTHYTSIYIHTHTHTYTYSSWKCVGNKGEWSTKMHCRDTLAANYVGTFTFMYTYTYTGNNTTIDVEKGIWSWMKAGNVTVLCFLGQCWLDIDTIGRQPTKRIIVFDENESSQVNLFYQLQ